MVYIKKRTIVICIAVVILLVGLLIIGFSPTITLKPTDETVTSDNSTGDTEMVRIATKSWANGKWIGDVDKTTIKTITFTNNNFQNVEGEKAWEYDGMHFVLNKDEITIYIPSGMKMKGSLHGAFQDMTSLQSIQGFSYFDTSECTEMSSMFANCTSLIAVDAPHLKTDSVLTANKMFYNCTALEHIDLTKCNMQRAIDMSEMFYGCINAQNIGLPKTEDVTTLKRAFSNVGTSTGGYASLIGELNTVNCTDMSEMFAKSMINNYTIAETFDTTSLKTAKSMFEACGLLEINLSQWKTDNLETAEKMFYDNMWCTSINISGWNTPKLESTASMFYYCSRLKELTIDWTEVKAITDASNMFKYCFGLTKLNLTGFNDAKIGNTTRMFESCAELQTIYCTQIYSDVSYYMFVDCPALCGKATYDASKITGDMANINGYFTQPHVTSE